VTGMTSRPSAADRIDAPRSAEAKAQQWEV
jgi:hypothetical protein